MLLFVFKIFLCCVNGWIIGAVVSNALKDRAIRLSTKLGVIMWSIANALGFVALLWGDYTWIIDSVRL